VRIADLDRCALFADNTTSSPEDATTLRNITSSWQGKTIRESVSDNEGDCMWPCRKVALERGQGGQDVLVQLFSPSYRSHSSPRSLVASVS